MKGFMVILMFQYTVIIKLVFNRILVSYVSYFKLLPFVSEISQCLLCLFQIYCPNSDDFAEMTDYANHNQVVILLMLYE